MRSDGSSFGAQRRILHVGNASNAKRLEINFCVLKPDAQVCVVNTILINHLLEGDTESPNRSVGKAYTPVYNGIYRLNRRVVPQAVDLDESWQGFCFYVLHLGQ